MAKTNLLDSILSAPKASASAGKYADALAEFVARIEKLEDGAEKQAALAFAKSEDGSAFLANIFAHSPYLSRLLHQHTAFFARLCLGGLEAGQEEITALMTEPASNFSSKEVLMAHLRRAKNLSALLTAIGDLSKLWTLEEVTGQLSTIAQSCLQLAANFLLLDAQKRGELTHIHPDAPDSNSGWIILGMGKLGAYELNYSSDIDLIVLFDTHKITYEGRQTAQQCFNRMTRDLVTIMQERTADGYVFRTDIRLRPDPSSTPPAVSANAALGYYESLGQNWERAAMIKARPVAGDLAAGKAFLKELTPFVWRRTLDFAAIADIHSIKRQIDYRTGTDIKLAGHNVKLGAGGIRSIEFFVQVHQLIWGGRQPELRHPGTCEMLHRLAKAGIIDAHIAQELDESYHFLRDLEHRVQMQNDQQYHRLPEQKAALEGFAEFAGFHSLQTMESTTLPHLRRVQEHSADPFETEHPLGHEGNLVFTGVDPDPGTIETLERMGFAQPVPICHIIMNWHRGHRRATRNHRAREILTELMPKLLEALSRTVNPDAAFIKFDEFLAHLPAGVQIFSLFSSNPELLQLIADLLGSAPRLAEILSRNPHLLDTVLTGEFYKSLPDKPTLQAELDATIEARLSIEEPVITCSRFRNEKAFQAGIQLLKNVAAPEQVAHFLSDLAEVILIRLTADVTENFAESYGRIPGSEMAVLGLGKLGGRALTFASDLDLIFVYHSPNPDQLSDGPRPFTASVYYNRLCQRLLGVLTSLNPDGRLYEVDTRLRPLGSDGPLAASFEAYDSYFTKDAWVFELMALTRARVIVAPENLKTMLEKTIPTHLTRSRNTEETRAAVNDMREKVAASFGTQNPWDVKYVRGGMMDVDFIAQYLQLIHGHQHPTILSPSSSEVFMHMEKAGILNAKNAQMLIKAEAFLSHILHLLRLCNDGSLQEETAPEDLKALLAERLGFEHFSDLKSTLIKTEATVYNVYTQMIGTENKEEFTHG